MRRKARERGINRRRYYERQQRTMGMSGKERKLSYCTANSTITIAYSHTYVVVLFFFMRHYLEPL